MTAAQLQRVDQIYPTQAGIDHPDAEHHPHPQRLESQAIGDPTRQQHQGGERIEQHLSLYVLAGQVAGDAAGDAEGDREEPFVEIAVDEQIAPIGEGILDAERTRAHGGPGQAGQRDGGE